MSFLLWRTISNKLSTDDKVVRLGIALNPQCYCCSLSNTRVEHKDIKHLFCQGDLAKKIWRKFAGSWTLDLEVTTSTWSYEVGGTTNPTALSPISFPRTYILLFVGSYGSQVVATNLRGLGPHFIELVLISQIVLCMLSGVTVKIRDN